MYNYKGLEMKILLVLRGIPGCIAEGTNIRGKWAGKANGTYKN